MKHGLFLLYSNILFDFFRHWKELMERTGTCFEINPDCFTLDNMFSMELHKYANVISDIVTSAVKELSIEKASFPLY